mmetsp:Transcript_8786/g.12470  ORF Transcript_8786/g.12470 Transcript_8786/m.12470 type:complete len:499 (-) Transcript_8786:791-2287(-)
MKQTKKLHLVIASRKINVPMDKKSQPNLSSIYKILSRSCPATRDEKTLDIIYKYVSEKTKISSNPLWKFLPRAYKLKLCAYFQYMILEEDELITMSSHHQDSKMFVLVRGTAEISCAHFIQPINNGTNFGELNLSRSVKKFISQAIGNNVKIKNVYYEFMKHMEDRGMTDKHGVVVTMHKCSHYLYICNIECRKFLTNLFDMLAKNRILNRLRLKQFQRSCSLYSIPSGHPIIIEGTNSNKIVLIMRGMCELKKNVKATLEKKRSDLSVDESPNTKETLKIGSAGPLHFLGFLPQFLNTNDHPYSAIATSNVKIILFNASEFKKYIFQIPQVYEAFCSLGIKQLDWLENIFPQLVIKEMSISCKTPATCEIEESQYDEFPSCQVELKKLMNSMLKSPRLNKHKVLVKFKRFIDNGENESMKYDYPEDPFSRFDTQCYNLDEDIELDLCEYENEVFESKTEDFHDILTPYPSILRSRKLHGKTLPAVPHSSGFFNPFFI